MEHNVRVFLAGASGVIGQRLIPRLVRTGHVVESMTRSAGKLPADDALTALDAMAETVARYR